MKVDGNTNNDLIDNSSISSDQLLKSNLLKIKQKIMDTSKVLDLCSSATNELTIIKKKNSSLQNDCINLRSQINNLISEKEPLLKEIKEKEKQIEESRKELERANVLYQSQKALNTQLTAELKDSKLENNKLKEKKELELFKKKYNDLNKSHTKLKSSFTKYRKEFKAIQVENKKYSKFLIDLLPILNTIPIDYLSHSYINDIEKIVGKSLSTGIDRKKDLECSNYDINILDSTNDTFNNDINITLDKSDDINNDTIQINNGLDDNIVNNENNIQNNDSKTDNTITILPNTSMNDNNINSNTDNTVTILSDTSSNETHSNVSANTIKLSTIGTKRKNNQQSTQIIKKRKISENEVQIIQDNNNDHDINDYDTCIDCDDSDSSEILLSSSPLEYPIDQLLASVELYNDKLDQCYPKWPIENDNTYIIRRLSKYLNTEKLSFPISNIFYQQRVLCTLYDISKYIENISSIIPHIISSLLSCQTSYLRSIRTKINDSFYKESISYSENTPSLKLSLICDLIWNLSRYDTSNNFIKGLSFELINKCLNISSNYHQILLCKNIIEFIKPLHIIHIIRSFIIQMLFKNEDNIKLLQVIIYLYPECLNQEKYNNNLLSQCILYILNNINFSQDIKNIIKHWKTNIQSKNDIVSNCISKLSSCNSLNNTSNQILFEIELVFQLLCKYEGWTWTYKYIICSQLSIFMVPTSSELLLSNTIRLLGLLCKQSIDITNNPSLRSIIQLRQRITSLIQRNSPCSLNVQIIAIEALLEMSNGYIFPKDDILLWYNRLTLVEKKNLPKILLDNINLFNS